MQVYVLGLAGSQKIQNVLPLVGEECNLICVHDGRWYVSDPRNHMICTCRFVVTIVIVSA